MPRQYHLLASVVIDLFLKHSQQRSMLKLPVKKWMTSFIEQKDSHANNIHTN